MSNAPTSTAATPKPPTPVELAGDATASPGEDVFLHIESDQPLAASVKVHLSVVQDKKEVASFDESLTSEPATPKDGSTKSAAKIRWTVKLTDDPKNKPVEPPAEVTYTVTDANGLTAMPDAPLVVRAIKVTDDARCRKIMLHEFNKKEGDDFVFDPAVAQKFLDDLSPQQRNLLVNYKPDAAHKAKGRLVAFATLTKPDKHRLMGADFTNAPFFTQAKSNASFTLFRVKGPQDDVELLCHTECHVLNFRNGFTATFFQKLDRNDPSIKMSGLDKKNPKPKMYKLCCGVPDQGNDDLVWIRCTTPDGSDIMPGNTMHGTINTVGCWMLFRNYNWPQSIYEKLDGIYRKVLRPSNAFWDDELTTLSQKEKDATLKLKADCDAQLAPLGYDAKDHGKGKFKGKEEDLSSSFKKFWGYDSNTAYYSFFDLFVGIGFWGYSKTVNDFAVDGQEVRPRFPLSKLPPAGVNNYHESSFFDNKGKTPDEVAANRAKAAGFWKETDFQSPAKTFADNTLSKDGKSFDKKKIVNIDAASWCDIYFFKEDGATVGQAT